MTIVAFDRGHGVNNYLGVDGGSYLRARFDEDASRHGEEVSWLFPGGREVLKETRLKYQPQRLVTAFGGMTEFRKFQEEAMKDLNVLKNVEEVTEQQVRSYKPSTLVVFYRSFKFPEWGTQMRLIVNATNRKGNVCIYDTDGWLLQDAAYGVFPSFLLDQCKIASPYEEVPRRPNWSYLPYQCDTKPHSYDLPRIFTLGYIGNDYDRREMLDQYFHTYNRGRRCLAGNWLRSKRKPWNGINRSSRWFAYNVLKIQEDELLGATPHFMTHAHLATCKFSLYAEKKDYIGLGHATLRVFESANVDTPPLVPLECTGHSTFLRSYVDNFPEYALNWTKNLSTMPLWIEEDKSLARDACKWIRDTSRAGKSFWEWVSS